MEAQCARNALISRRGADLRDPWNPPERPDIVVKQALGSPELQRQERQRGRTQCDTDESVWSARTTDISGVLPRQRAQMQQQQIAMARKVYMAAGRHRSNAHRVQPSRSQQIISIKAEREYLRRCAEGL